MYSVYWPLLVIFRRNSFGYWGQVDVTLLYRWTDWYTDWCGLS